MDFDKPLRRTNFALMFSGIYLKNDHSTLHSFINFIFYLNLIWIQTEVLGEISWVIEGIQGSQNFGEISLIIPCTAMSILGTAKCAQMFFNQDTISTIVNKLRDMHPKFDDTIDIGEENTNTSAFKVICKENHTKNKESEKVEKEIVKETMKILNILMTMFFISIYVCATFFIVITLVIMGYEYYKTGKLILKLPYTVNYSFDLFTVTTWPLEYLHQVGSTLIVGSNIFGVDSFLSAICAYVRMHFLILCHRFKNVIESSNAVTKEQVIVLINRHQDLIQLVNQLELVFSKSILFNMVTSSFVICLCGFNATFSYDSGTMFTYIAFMIAVMSQTFTLCLFGDLLVSSSAKLSEAIYSCRWYDSNSDVKRLVFIILIRSQKPCKLTADKFADLNLRAFTTILSRSWSYFALLRTVYK